MRKFTRFPLLAVSLSAAACSAPTPEADDIKVAVSSEMPGYFVEDVNCEFFENSGQGGSGRASCAGSARLNQDLFRKADGSEILSDLKSHTGRRLPRLPTGIPPVLVRTAKSGELISFTSECGYIEVVDGWNLTCSSEYRPLNGRHIQSFSGRAIVQATDAYRTMLDEQKQKIDDASGAYDAVVSEVRKFFEAGKKIQVFRVYGAESPRKPLIEFTSPGGMQFVFQDNQRDEDRSRMTPGGGWSTDRSVPQFLSSPNMFRLQTKYRAVEGVPHRQLCNGRGDPGDDLLVNGIISMVRDRRGGNPPNFVAKVKLHGRDPIRGDRFGCSWTFSWDGERWIDTGYSHRGRIFNEMVVAN